MINESSYIQFDAPNRKTKTRDENYFKQLIKRTIRFILPRVFPIANPDFETKIDDVKVWLIECDSTSGIPQREIGLNSHGEAITKMPHNKNYGYWTDNNLLLGDFRQHFEVSEISKEYFENHWEFTNNESGA